MLVKWAVGGAVVGLIAAISVGENIGAGIVFGAIISVAIRKWILRNLWM